VRPPKLDWPQVSATKIKEKYFNIKKEFIVYHDLRTNGKAEIDQNTGAILCDDSLWKTMTSKYPSHSVRKYRTCGMRNYDRLLEFFLPNPAPPMEGESTTVITGSKRKADQVPLDTNESQSAGEGHSNTNCTNFNKHTIVSKQFPSPLQELVESPSTQIGDFTSPQPAYGVNGLNQNHRNSYEHVATASINIQRWNPLDTNSSTDQAVSTSKELGAPMENIFDNGNSGIRFRATRLLQAEYGNLHIDKMISLLDAFQDIAKAEIFTALNKGPLRDKWVVRHMNTVSGN
jgi:hypothetical protein